MKETYDYREAVKNDVLRAIRDNYTEEEIRENLEDPDDFAEKLHDDLWTDDSVTGNGSGSYTFSTWKAEENLTHNWDLVEETAAEFCCDPVIGTDYKNGPEFWDVSIRCYLLGTAISEALEELEEELNS